MDSSRKANISSANGQAFRAALESAQAILAPLATLDYYQQPLPSATDEALAGIANVFTAWSSTQRRRFLDGLPESKRSLFAIFGHRAATLAVRRVETEWLRLGLIGYAIAGHTGSDSGKSDKALAVFYHCAHKLDIDPEKLFDEAAEYATDSVALRMRAFGRRRDVTLNQFGWREIRTREGIRYKFEW
jgi:hypothetical protein